MIKTENFEITHAARVNWKQRSYKDPRGRNKRRNEIIDLSKQNTVVNRKEL